MFINILISLALLLTVIVVVSVITQLWSTIPYVPTQRTLIREAISYADLKDGETIYDLGAGDGRVLGEAKKAFPSVRAIGYECVISVWMWSRLRKFLTGEKTDLRFGNFFKADLRDADVIFLYLFPNVMGRLEEKFKSELRPGTRIVSHAFRFKDLKPVSEKTVRCGRKDRRLLLYVWPDGLRTQ